MKKKYFVRIVTEKPFTSIYTPSNKWGVYKKLFGIWWLKKTFEKYKEAVEYTSKLNS